MRYLTFALALLLCSVVSASTRIDLVIDEPFADRTAAWPVTTGVPFPRSGLKSVEHCRLVDSRGVEQPLQAKVAATWDAAATSVRWLTIDFIAQPGEKYALEFGDDVQRKQFDTAINIAAGPAPRVETGAITTEFNTTGGSFLKSVATDLNGDGRIAADEVIAAGDAAGEHYYLDQSGQRFSSAGDDKDRQIVVESPGPVRACVRVDGFYTGPKGQRVVKYRTRLHFFAGLPIIKVIDEFGVIASTKETRWRDIGFALDLKQDTRYRTVTIDASGEPGNQPLSQAWHDDTQAIASFQTTHRHYGNPEHHAAAARVTPQGSQSLVDTERMGEWMQSADRRAAVTGSLRWFWQQFPKEWETNPGQLVLHLWSPRAGELDFGAEGIARFFGPWGEKYLRSGQEQRNRNPLENLFYYAEVGPIQQGAADGLGVNKHHEFLLHFAPASRAKEGAEYARLWANQPLALATGAWNCGTDVFGPLAARPNDSKYEAAVDQLFAWGRQMQDQFGDYGWWLFGAGPHYSYQWDPNSKRLYADSRRFEFHTYQKETQLWWNYLRSGERKFYDWAIPSENHWVDIAVSHMPTTIECDWRGGEQVHRTLHWRPGEWAIDSPTHYVRHHNTAEAWLRGAAQFWGSYHRTLETTTLAYYITGDERFNDVIEYWRTWFGELGGKTSSSPDLQPWYREQAWYRPTGAGASEKSWAAMIRDYAPFRSGTRHELTMGFSLATLYEHTWDERVGAALKDFADAFLEPEHPIGLWRPQDSRLPSHAEAPSMGHFWVPWMWKYARVTGDPRMKDIFARYFDAGYAADPFRGYEDVGIYSNHYLGYAYYFTRDPRHLPLAARELDLILAYADPLTKPDDINSRLYNPYAPARTFAGAPRLIWALEEARRQGVAIKSAPPMLPQRTAISLYKPAGKPLTARLWGFEKYLKLIGPDAMPYVGFTVKTSQYVSEIQPFDRTLPGFKVYLHELDIPAAAPEGHYLLSPRLEAAVLHAEHNTLPWLNAARPLELRPNDLAHLRVPPGSKTLRIESAWPQYFRLAQSGGELQTPKVKNNTAEFELSAGASQVTLQVLTRSAWFRVAEAPEEACWAKIDQGALSSARRQTSSGTMPLDERETSPGKSQTLNALRFLPAAVPGETFVAGRFDQAVQIVPGQPLRIPDHIEQAGGKTPLFRTDQGTIEFWVKKLWDERTVYRRQVNYVLNGRFTVNPERLPLGEWTHVALVWAPYKGDPNQTITYLYINGLDEANYRSFNWVGYSSNRASSGPKAVKLLEHFLSQAAPDTAFVIDEFRVSSTPRYADLTVAYGNEQTFNPFRFEPQPSPFQPDSDTLLLLHFDGDLKTAVPNPPLSATMGK